VAAIAQHEPPLTASPTYRLEGKGLEPASLASHLSTRTIRKLAAALGVEPEELVEVEGDDG
jgi:hypothetical protein